MNEEKRVYILKWFEKADHDLLNAETILKYQPLVLDTACFHCQQAVEKYLKAYLIYRDKIIEKIHDIIKLQNSCSELDSDFGNIDLEYLDDYSVDIRYPDDAFAPSLEETKEYLKIAEDIKELVRKKIDFSEI